MFDRMLKSILVVLTVSILVSGCSQNISYRQSDKDISKVNTSSVGEKNGTNNAENSSIENQTNNIYSESQLSDINGDGNEEKITISRNLGLGENDDVKLLISDSESNTVLFGKSISDVGVGPNIFIGDFNGDRLKDVLASISFGGSSGDKLYTLVTYRNSKFVEIPLENMDVSKYINIGFANNSVRLFSEAFNKDVTFILTPEQTDIYNQFKGQNYDIGYFNTTLIEPVDVDNDGIYELRQTSFFSITHGQEVSKVLATFKYFDNHWEPFSLDIMHVKQESEVVGTE